MKSNQLKIKEEFAEIHQRKELRDLYLAKILKRYESVLDFKNNSTEFQTFITNKDFKSNDYFNFRLRCLKSQLKLDKQLQEEYLIDCIIFIENKISEIDKFFYNPDEDDKDESVYIDFLYQYDVINRQTFLKSMLYENYSYLEIKMREICNIVERKESRKLKSFAKNRKESYLDIYRKFLTGNNLNCEEKIICINSYRTIRNYLTHEVVSFKSIPQNVKKIVSSNPYLQLENRQVFISDDKYISNLINCVHSYLELIINELILKNS